MDEEHDFSRLGSDQPGRARAGRGRAILLAAALVIAIGVVVSAAVWRSGGDDSGTAARSSSDSAPDSLEVGSRLPDVEGRTFSGIGISLRELDVPATIHVYASWCPTCRAEAPAFRAMQREAGDTLQHHYIAVQDTEEPALARAREYGWVLDDSVVFDDADREFEDALGLGGQPHTIFVDADGVVTSIQRGPGTQEQLIEQARAALDG